MTQVKRNWHNGDQLCAHPQNQSYARAYLDSEFVVANTLAKWKKMEPNEINFSQGFNQKVVSSCFVFNSLPARGQLLLSADNLCKQLDPDQARQNVGPSLEPKCLTPGW